MTKGQVSDEELWGRIKEDNSVAFEILFERYWTSIYRTCYIYLKDQEACTELVHDIFLNIWKKRHALEIQCFKNYLTSAARYHVYKVIKKESRNPILLVEDYAAFPSKQCALNSGEENLLYTDLEQNVHQVLNTLPARCKEIFILSRFDYLSNEEIATQLGISKRSVENQLTHALKVLRAQIAHHTLV